MAPPFLIASLWSNQHEYTDAFEPPISKAPPSVYVALLYVKLLLDMIVSFPKTLIAPAELAVLLSKLQYIIWVFSPLMYIAPAVFAAHKVKLENATTVFTSSI